MLVIACLSCSNKGDPLPQAGETEALSSPARSQAQPSNPVHPDIAIADDEFSNTDSTSVLSQTKHPLLSDDMLRRAAMTGAKRLDSNSSNNEKDGVDLTLSSSMADSVIEMLGIEKTGKKESPLDIEINVSVGEGADDFDVSESGISKGNFSATVSDEEEIRVQWNVDF